MNLFQRSIAASISAALVLTAPGLPAYAAVGQSRATTASGATVRVAPVVTAVPTSLGTGINLHTTNLGVGSLPGAVGVNAAASAANPAAASAAASPLGLAPATLGGTKGAVPNVTAAAAARPASSNSAVEAAQAAAKAAASEGVKSERILNLAFDGAKTEAGADGVTGGQGVGMAPLAPAQTQTERDGGGVPPSAPNGGGDDQGPQEPRKPGLWLVLGLGAAFGAGAWLYAAPAAVTWLTAHGMFMGYATLAKIGVTAAGVLTGFSFSQYPTWKGFVGELRDGVVQSAVMTFRFWARFGLIFDSVLRGKSADEAMKAPITGNLLKYPVGAWLAVLIGYVTAPVAALIGFAYKAIETPVLAAFRGLKQVALDFFPWLADVLRFVRRVLARFFPFVGGLIWGAVRAEGLGLAVGAFGLGAPFVRYVVGVDYSAKSLPGWVFARLIQLAALVFTLSAGVVGAGVGLVVAVPFALTEAARMSLNWAKVGGKVSLALEAWYQELDRGSNGDALTQLFEQPFRRGAIEPGQGLTRLFNIRFASLFLAPVMALGALALYVRAWTRSRSGERPSAKIDYAIAEREGDAPAAGYGASVLRSAKETAQTTLSYWRYLGLATHTALIGSAPAKDSTPLLAWPALFFGYVGAGIGWAGGALYEALEIPGASLWSLFMRLVSRFIPTLKRILNFALRVIKEIVPFALGFVVGTVGGVFQTAWAGVKALAAPFGFLIDSWDRSEEDTFTFTAVTLVRVASLVPALAAVIVGAVAGALTGIPAALTNGAATAVKWASTGDNAEKWADGWRRQTFRRELTRVSLLGEGVGTIKKSSRPVYRTAATALSVTAGVPAAALALLVAWVPAYLRAVRLQGGDKWAHESPNTNRRTTPKAAFALAPAWLTAAAGIAGAAAGVWFAPSLLLGAAFGLGGLFAGFALVQPGFWTGLIPAIGGDAKAGVEASWTTWSQAGDAFASVLRGEPVTGSKLGYVHRALGVVLALPLGALGLAFGAASQLVGAAVEGATNVVNNILPFLRGVWETILRIGRRILPFFGGLLAGVVTGVVGSATFGALLLGRPYFKHVAAKDFQSKGLGQWLGAAALRTTAVVLGVVFGLLGLVAGVIAAAPYALTLPVSMAFQLAEIGGNGQRFFDLWSKGTLRVEMRRLNLLTDRFEFPEGQDGAVSLVDGWVRLANIFAATFAAAIAATVAGYVAYVRSLINAFKDLRAGKNVPAGGYDDMSRVSRTAWKGAKLGAKTGAWVGGWGTLIVLSVLAFKSGGLIAGFGTALWKSVVGWLGGWIAGAFLGLVIGMGVGLVLWLADQLDKDPLK